LLAIGQVFHSCSCTLIILGQDNIFIIQDEKLSGGEVAAIAVSISLAGVIMSKKN